MVMVRFEGHPTPVFGRDQPIAQASVSPDYFHALGTPLKRGRMLNERDNETALPVALMNEALVRRYFPDEDPIGKRFGGPGAEWTTIVGVVGDMRQNGLEGDSLPEIYRPYLQSSRSFMMLALRTDGNPLNLAPAVRRIVTSIDKNQPVHNVMTMEQRLANSVAPRRLIMFLLGVFAMLALVLAAVGIYGVMSYSVARRIHEIGIRVALGAETGDVLALVVRQGMKMAAAGILLGLAGALVLTRSLSSLLFGVKSTDPLTLVAVCLLLAAVALLACYVPARSATKVDPMVALRHE
jgi:putative ABC transport system permease protein